MSFWAPSIDKGALRKRLRSPFSRISCRIRRSSSPCSPWMPGVPLLARRRLSPEQMRQWEEVAKPIIAILLGEDVPSALLTEDMAA
jgi:hypothetical protein